MGKVNGSYCAECGARIYNKHYTIYESHNSKPRELCKSCYEKALIRLFGKQDGKKFGEE